MWKGISRGSYLLDSKFHMSSLKKYCQFILKGVVEVRVSHRAKIGLMN